MNTICYVRRLGQMMSGRPEMSCRHLPGHGIFFGMKNTERIQELYKTRTLPDAEMAALLTDMNSDDEAFLYELASNVRREKYGREVYLRGLIEFTNICRNDCYYCGLRRSNGHADRYRLSKDEILTCARMGYGLGFRTFVLQGGEDPYFTDERLSEIVAALRAEFPDCAITLSVGERSKESYRLLKEAGADRYLLRQETSGRGHYRSLHPADMSFDNRRRCLADLKELGYQVGCGIMVGSPGQTADDILEDLHFMKELQPQMIGIGPFIPHRDTPFAGEKAGSVQDTLHLLAIIRLMLPSVLLPATTALGTLDPHGREKGLQAGANVIMPNLSPANVREKYLLYDGKLCTGDEAAESVRDMKRRIASVGYEAVVSRGDALA